MARKGARVETSLHLCQCRTTSFMYRFADEPKIVLVDPCCTPSKDRSRLPLLGRISCVWEDWCFCNLRKCLEPLKRCISTVWVILDYLAKLIYLIASQVCFSLNLYVLWFIQVALLGSVAAMARWLGTELLELTATDNGRGLWWYRLVFRPFSCHFLSLLDWLLRIQVHPNPLIPRFWQAHELLVTKLQFCAKADCDYSFNFILVWRAFL